MNAKINEIMNTSIEVKSQIVNDPAFLAKIEKHGIACMDLIHSVTVCENNKQYICGKGYSDNKIINNYVTREYNTEKINKIINV